MACTDLDFSWKDCSSHSNRLKRSLWRCKQTRELLWTPHPVLHNSRRSPSEYQKFSLGRVEDTLLTLHHDHIALLDLIKACSKHKDLLKGTRIHAVVLEKGLFDKNISIGNAILSMYAKCGAPTKAQETFNQLSARNVVTWNVLITAYVQNGLADEALSCFERMQDEGFSPNAITFICILKACGSLRAVEKGEEIHDEVSKQGLLEKDIVLGTALVDMYAKCGMLEKAQCLFDSLPARNVITWNALIAGYAQHGFGDEALSCFGRMQDEGLSPDATTYICILKACGSTGAVVKGEEIHAEISRQGLLENDIVLGTALVDMYSKCGVLAKAQGVFDKLPTRNVVMWNALIAGYAHHGLSDEALSCYGRMRDEGHSPDAVTFICTLKACASIGAVEKGEEIHAEVDRQEILGKDIVLGSALVDMYAKCGMLAKARALFDKLPAQNVVMWNAIIAGYTRLGFGTEALRCFEQMCDKGFSPDKFTFVCVLKACGSLGAAEMGEEIHAEIGSQGLLESDIMLGNALVDMYVKCGRLTKAQDVFDKLPTRNVVTWNALIAGYAQLGLGDEALSCFSQMQDDGLSPDRVTFICVLKACGSIGATEMGIEIHAEVNRQHSSEEDTVLGNALVDMYGKCGALARAQEVFDKLQALDVATWTSLIAGYAQHGKDDEALIIYERMRDKGLSPNAITFICALKACGSIGASEKGEMIHAEVSSLGLLENDIVLGNALINMYAKCGAFAKAQKVFDVLPSRGVDTWTALITGYAQAGKFRTVFDLFMKMVGEGIEPNMVTFVVLLSACSHAGLVQEGQMYFDSMTTIYCIIPTLEHRICMVDIFSRAGCFDKAMSIIMKAPGSDCLLLWSALMGACKKSVNVELGRQAFDHVVQLDGKFTAAYVYMSGIYAAAGMQEEASRIPGCCWLTDAGR